MLNLNVFSEKSIVSYNRQNWFFEPRLNYFVSEVMEKLNIEDKDEIAASVNRAIQVCGTLQLPQHCNFKKVYRFDGENMIMDWKISSMACYLIIINCNPKNEYVAKAQLHFAIFQTPFYQ